MRLVGELILLSGSASQSCPVEKLSVAHSAIRELTLAILGEGGGLIVFAGGEPLASDGGSLPLIFDWTVLRTLEKYLDGQPRQPTSRYSAVVITSNKAMARKMSDENRQLISRLSQRQAVDIIFVEDELHTGGNIRDAQLERAGAMISLGGGKGVADEAAKLIRRGKPVLPLDLAIGALSGDGEGALALHRRLLTEPSVFFPQTHTSVRGLIPSLSLEMGSVDPLAVALRIVDAIAAERAAAVIAAPRSQS